MTKVICYSYGKVLWNHWLFVIVLTELNGSAGRRPEFDSLYVRAFHAGQLQIHFLKIEHFKGIGAILRWGFYSVTGFLVMIPWELLFQPFFMYRCFGFGQTGEVCLLSRHSIHVPWFQYYIFEYELSDFMEVGVGLKAHVKVAEYLGARFSFSF